MTKISVQNPCYRAFLKNSNRQTRPLNRQSAIQVSETFQPNNSLTKIPFEILAANRNLSISFKGETPLWDDSRLQTASEALDRLTEFFNNPSAIKVISPPTQEHHQYTRWKQDYDDHLEHFSLDIDGKQYDFTFQLNYPKKISINAPDDSERFEYDPSYNIPGLAYKKEGKSLYETHFDACLDQDVEKQVWKLAALAGLKAHGKEDSDQYKEVLSLTNDYETLTLQRSSTTNKVEGIDLKRFLGTPMAVTSIRDKKTGELIEATITKERSQGSKSELYRVYANNRQVGYMDMFISKGNDDIANPKTTRFSFFERNEFLKKQYRKWNGPKVEQGAFAHVSFLENFDQNKYGKVGTKLMQLAVERSLQEGCQGKVNLSSARNSQGFYYLLGFRATNPYKPEGFNKDISPETIDNMIENELNRSKQFNNKPNTSYLSGIHMHLPYEGVQQFMENIEKEPILGKNS